MKTSITSKRLPDAAQGHIKDQQVFGESRYAFGLEAQGSVESAPSSTFPERVHTERVHLNQSERDLFLLFGSEYGVEQVPHQFVVLEVRTVSQGSWFLGQCVVVRDEYSEPVKKTYFRVPGGWWWRLISHRSHQGTVRVAMIRRA